MTATTTAGVYLLDREHANAVERLATDPSFAALLDIAHPPISGVGAQVVERLTRHRTEGKAYWSAVVDRGDVKGVTAVLDPYDTQPRILVWIAPAARRHGYGSFALSLTLELAFKNFQRERVQAIAPSGDPAVEKTVAQVGFVASASAMPNAARWELSRVDWIAARDKPALAKLHADLRTILDAELAAGNQIVETGGGWPDPDSVFVRLRDPFRTTPASLPPGIVYTEPNDPHWWKADYTSSAPRHTLAC
jgi:RimJ/RimL family protein N-acetyltransferase